MSIVPNSRLYSLPAHQSSIAPYYSAHIHLLLPVCLRSPPPHTHTHTLLLPTCLPTQARWLPGLDCLHPLTPPPTHTHLLLLLPAHPGTLVTRPGLSDVQQISVLQLQLMNPAFSTSPVNITNTSLTQLTAQVLALSPNQVCGP